MTFASNGKARRIKGLSRLDMLPSQSSPLLLFLGVDESAGSAVFLVDSTLKGTGEGTCSPSPSDCGVLALGAGSEHEFVDEDGNSYAIRIDEIRRVKVSKASASKRKVATSSRRRFKPRILTDLMTETISARGRLKPRLGRPIGDLTDATPPYHPLALAALAASAAVPASAPAEAEAAKAKSKRPTHHPRDADARARRRDHDHPRPQLQLAAHAQHGDLPRPQRRAPRSPSRLAPAARSWW